MAIDDIEKRSRGRPKTEATPVMVRVQPDMLVKLDDFRKAEADAPSRPEAIRRLVERALEGDALALEP